MLFEEKEREVKKNVGFDTKKRFMGRLKALDTFQLKIDPGIALNVDKNYQRCKQI